MFEALTVCENLELAQRPGGLLSHGQEQFEQFYDFAEALADQYLVMSRGEFVRRGRGENMQAEGVRGLATL